MSFSRARDLIRLAQMAAARRVTDAPEETFGTFAAADGEGRKRRWRLVNPALSQVQLRPESGVEALAIADHAARLRRPAGPRRGGRGNLALGPRGRLAVRGLVMAAQRGGRAATGRQPDPTVPRGRERR
jgi:hypothetical protein